MHPPIVLILCLLANLPPASGGENWPQFRGPTGLGYSDEKDLPVRWGGPARENVLWTSPLVGAGHASPIVWGDAVFVCTVKWPGKPPGGGAADESVMPEHHVACYRAADGKLLWDTQVPPGPWLRDDFRSGAGGGYAGPTPVTDAKLVYCVFGSSVIAALDFQGRIAWRKEIAPHTFDVTVGSSPVLYRDTVLQFCAMAKASDSQVIAFAKADGSTKWRQKLAGMEFGHSTPVIIEVEGRPQMLVLASGMSEKGNALRSLDPATGKLLWWCRGAGDAASPAFGSGIVYFDSGRGGKGVAVEPGGSGDISATRVRWTGPVIPEAISSPIIVGAGLSLAQAGRLEMLGRDHRQAGLFRAAERDFLHLGQPRGRRQRPSLFRQRGEKLRYPVRTGVPRPGRQRPWRRQPSIGGRCPRAVVSGGHEEHLLHRTTAVRRPRGHLFNTSSRFINSFVSIVQAASVAGSSFGSTGAWPNFKSSLAPSGWAL